MKTHIPTYVVAVLAGLTVAIAMYFYEQYRKGNAPVSVTYVFVQHQSPKSGVSINSDFDLEPLMTGSNGTAGFDDVSKGVHIFTYRYKNIVYNDTIIVSANTPTRIINLDTINQKPFVTSTPKLKPDSQSQEIPFHKNNNNVIGETKARDMEPRLNANSPGKKSLNETAIKDTDKKPTTIEDIFGTASKKSAQGDLNTRHNTRTLDEILGLNNNSTSRYRRPTDENQANNEVSSNSAHSALDNRYSSYPIADHPILYSSVNTTFYTNFEDNQGGLAFWTDCQDCHWKVKIGTTIWTINNSSDTPPVKYDNSVLLIRVAGWEKYRFEIIDRSGAVTTYDRSVAPGSTVIYKIQKPIVF